MIEKKSIFLWSNDSFCATTNEKKLAREIIRGNGIRLELWFSVSVYTEVIIHISNTDFYHKNTLVTELRNKTATKCAVIWQSKTNTLFSTTVTWNIFQFFQLKHFHNVQLFVYKVTETVSIHCLHATNQKHSYMNAKFSVVIFVVFCRFLYFLEMVPRIVLLSFNSK